MFGLLITQFLLKKNEDSKVIIMENKFSILKIVKIFVIVTNIFVFIFNYDYVKRNRKI